MLPPVQPSPDEKAGTAQRHAFQALKFSSKELFGLPFQVFWFVFKCCSRRPVSLLHCWELNCTRSAERTQSHISWEQKKNCYMRILEPRTRSVSKIPVSIMKILHNALYLQRNNAVKCWNEFVFNCLY
jgi:hypothetical protein